MALHVHRSWVHSWCFRKIYIIVVGLSFYTSVRLQDALHNYIPHSEQPHRIMSL